MKIIILFLLLFVLTPAPDTECVDDWAIIRQYENYCDNNGAYTLYVCTIQKERNGELYTTVKFKSECSVNGTIPAKELHLFYLPIVTTGCPEGAFLTEGYCTILGVPIVP